jgi:mannan endo-1,4-beta-mannosidase
MVNKPIRLIAAVVLILAAALVAAPVAHAAPAGFVTRSGGQFMLNGSPYRFGGTNNYYLHYSSKLMVDDVFNDAQAAGLNVIRAWTFLECGGAKPNSAGACQNGADHWMQRWSATTNSVEYNTGPTGLQQIDYMLDKAQRSGIKLILVFAGNWRDFGGMDQYDTWYGLPNHDQFYTDARVKQDYKNWITTLLNRTNTITGVQYKNDPTVFSWELANEPRCINTSLPTSGTCTAATITNWADEMSTFTKSIDPNHMVSVGDEGFHPGQVGPSNSWPYNITDGVDHQALTALPNIDFGTYHMYPQGWGQSPVDTWSNGWVRDHDATGASLTKPEVLEEFGTTDQSTRDASYRMWLDTVRTTGGAGFLVWILTGLQDTGSCTVTTCPLYPDFDGFRVNFPSSTVTVLTNESSQIGTGTSTDTMAPSTPGTPTAVPNGLSATLFWTASSDNVGVTAYDVVRVQGAAETALASITGNPPATTLALTGLASGQQYVVAVYARDAAGNRSTRSGTVSFVTPVVDPIPPTAPTNATASNITATGATLTWGASTAPGSTVAVYEVLRIQGTTQTVLATVTGSPPATTTTLTGLSAATQYTLAVRARNAQGLTGPASASISVTTSNTTTGGCRVTYGINWVGGNGFGATASITNLGTAAITGWTLTFTLPAGQSFSSGYNGQWTAGSPLRVDSFAWNATIAAGATLSQSPAFQGTFTGGGTPAKPTAFTLNGTACSIG